MRRCIVRIRGQSKPNFFFLQILKYFFLGDPTGVKLFECLSLRVHVRLGLEIMPGSAWLSVGWMLEI